jgi:hypothetical protein
MRGLTPFDDAPNPRGGNVDNAEQEPTPFPKGIGAPATRALTGAGYTSLESLAGAAARQLGSLHGFGPKALRILTEALEAKGLSLG